MVQKLSQCELGWSCSQNDRETLEPNTPIKNMCVPHAQSHARQTLRRKAVGDRQRREQASKRKVRTSNDYESFMIERPDGIQTWRSSAVVDCRRRPSSGYKRVGSRGHLIPSVLGSNQRQENTRDFTQRWGCLSTPRGTHLTASV